MPSPTENTPPLPFPDAPSRPLPPLEDIEAAFTRYEKPEPPRWRRYALHLGLFLLTLLTTTLAGAEWMTGNFTFGSPTLTQAEILRGLWFSVPFLGVLAVHEFGHYFTARRNSVRASLPFFIPFFTGLFSTIGTFGAVIRIKDRIFSRREFFDIGLAGPLAGFLVAVPVLIYGFLSLPPAEYVFQVHPEYQQYGADYARYVYQGGQGLTLAKPLLYQGLEYLFADPARLPHPNELTHYPVLLAGALALFFTALNLLPIGQLDGGHILYGLLGAQRFNRLSAVLFIGFIFYAGLGLFSLQTTGREWLYWGLPYFGYLFLVLRRVVPTPRRALHLSVGVWAAQLACAVAWPGILGNPGWLVFGLLLSRVMGIFHPPALDETPLSPGRKVLGWLMLAIFVLCFTPSPFTFS
ncbi:site-2 protease family protein [Hymenobacter psychrotolerans]|uniref:Peptidase family M50 n=1 Tax=Hymenobacter psychrotolerans DSM 18569 TaxID=1121959 RepID=A0A1M6W251_9BACT|nr:site-2 protease family protein [Hymenobacter psychrotolerans]SHK87824.1 Peptidase family M50 [Hymenobacter psychrotolerans DSM 18569]